MNGCGIGAEGGKALAEALASHSDLMIVELMNNNLGEDGQGRFATMLCWRNGARWGLTKTFKGTCPVGA